MRGKIMSGWRNERWKNVKMDGWMRDQMVRGGGWQVNEWGLGMKGESIKECRDKRWRDEGMKVKDISVKGWVRWDVKWGFDGKWELKDKTAGVWEVKNEGTRGEERGDEWIVESVCRMKEEVKVMEWEVSLILAN